MSHHLPPERHLEIHQEHVKRIGMYSSSIYTVNIPEPARDKQTTLYIEVCLQCGFVDKTYCQHGASTWQHRPGCAQYDDKRNISAIGVPEMYTPYSEAFPTGDQLEPGTHCEGCLLVCPVCKADGT